MSKVFLSPATFVGASLAGALLFAGFLGFVATRNAPSASRVPPRQVATAPRIVVEPARPGVAFAATPVRTAGGAATCPVEPLVQARAGGDGRFALASALVAGSEVQPAAFVSVAREAAQAGRARDAEVALLAACTLAERAGGGQSAALADLKTELGQHYLLQARGEASVPVRQQLLQRASALFSESASAYALALGRNASKTRMAQQRVAMLRAVTAPPAAAAPAPPVTAAVTAPADAAPPEPPAAGSAVMGAARAHAPDDRPAAAVREGACSGSAARRLVCADPELAQIDRDLQRLHAQASRVARDRAGMRRRDSFAMAREAACQDKPCLLRWYAQRRRQLLSEF